MRLLWSKIILWISLEIWSWVWRTVSTRWLETAISVKWFWVILWDFIWTSVSWAISLFSAIAARAMWKWYWITCHTIRCDLSVRKFLITFHCSIKICFWKLGLSSGFVYLFSGHVEILCPELEHFLQNVRKSGFPLKLGSFEYLYCTTFIPWAISCSVVCISSTVRLSISRQRFLIEGKRVEFVFNLGLSIYVLVISSWCIIWTSCAKLKLWFQCGWFVICNLFKCYSSSLWIKCFDKCVNHLCIPHIQVIVSICFSDHLFYSYF